MNFKTHFIFSLFFWPKRNGKPTAVSSGCNTMMLMARVKNIYIKVLAKEMNERMKAKTRLKYRQHWHEKVSAKILQYLHTHSHILYPFSSPRSLFLDKNTKSFLLCWMNISCSERRVKLYLHSFFSVVFATIAPVCRNVYAILMNCFSARIPTELKLFNFPYFLLLVLLYSSLSLTHSLLMYAFRIDCVFFLGCLMLCRKSHSNCTYMCL